MSHDAAPPASGRIQLRRPHNRAIEPAVASAKEGILADPTSSRKRVRDNTISSTGDAASCNAVPSAGVVPSVPTVAEASRFPHTQPNILDSTAAPCGPSPLPTIHPELHCSLPALTSVPLYPVDEPFDSVFDVHLTIGEGTYGEVLDASEKKNPTNHVAIKRLKSLEQLEGFPITSLREIMVLNYLNTLSPEEQSHFVVLKRVVLSKDFRSTYLVFDFVEHSLSGLMMRRVNLDNREVAYLFQQIFVALKILHSHQVVHRDIKANNVLITEKAEIKLCDFGLAFAVTNERKRFTPRLITFDYRPPEMLVGMPTYGPAVDIWSVGCLLAQWYLGYAPFRQSAARSDKSGAGEVEQLCTILHVIGGLEHPAPTCASLPASAPSSLDATVSALDTKMREMGIGSSATTGEQVALSAPVGFATWFQDKLQSNHRAPIPPAALDLLSCIFRLHPTERPSAEDLLKHPFFSVCDSFVHVGLQLKLREFTFSHDMLVRDQMKDRHSFPY